MAAGRGVIVGMSPEAGVGAGLGVWGGDVLGEWVGDWFGQDVGTIAGFITGVDGGVVLGVGGSECVCVGLVSGDGGIGVGGEGARSCELVSAP